MTLAQPQQALCRRPPRFLSLSFTISGDGCAAQVCGSGAPVRLRTYELAVAFEVHGYDVLGKRLTVSSYLHVSGVDLVRVKCRPVPELDDETRVV